MTIENLKKIQDLLKLVNDNIDLSSADENQLIEIVDELKVIKRICNKSIIEIEGNIFNQIENSLTKEIQFGSYKFKTLTSNVEYKKLVREIIIK
ncbi:MAG: hypothetical protein ACRCXZ_06230 [Patescibacteria group bacterium]